MSKKIIVIQDGIKECGSACLLSIIRYYGGNISLQELLKLTNTTKEGTTFYDLKCAAYEIDKNKEANIIHDIMVNTLTLITCKDNSDTKQIVYIAYLISTEKY